MPLIPSRNAAVFFSVLVPHYPLQMISLDPALSFFRSISSARYPELENEGQESKISRTLKQPSTHHDVQEGGRQKQFFRNMGFCYRQTPQDLPIKFPSFLKKYFCRKVEFYTCRGCVKLCSAHCASVIFTFCGRPCVQSGGGRRLKFGEMG